ncbi:MAG: efflux RND transporter periplasmic adaptor subunit [Granulosicoccaceae bacterium]
MIASKLHRSAFLFTFILAATGCNSTSSEVENTAPEQARPAKIHTLRTVQSQLLRSYPATLEASSKSNLAFRVSGQLRELPARAGVQVKKGDLLARLDNSDYQNALDARNAAYKLAKVQYDQAKKLQAKNLASQLQLDQATASLKSAQANRTQAQDNFRYTRLTAPFDGIVARVNIDNHQAVQAGTPVLQLQASEQLDVSFSVPESLISQMSRIPDPKLLAAICGQVFFSTHPKDNYHACYKEHELVPDPLTRNYKVLFNVDTPETFTALPGMSANIVLDFSAFMAAEQEPLLVAPIEAVHEFQGESYVWRVDDAMRAKRVKVGLGTLGDHGFEILDGLQPGDKLVAAGLSHLRDNMLLKPLVKERGL